MLAALIALVAMVGCVYRVPYRDGADDAARRPSRLFLICVFASCKVSEPPTPPPSSASERTTLNPQASRLDSQRVGGGARPLTGVIDVPETVRTSR